MSLEIKSPTAMSEMLGLLKESGVRWVDDTCYRWGASLAYYALFSLFPLLLLSVTVVGLFLGQDPENRQRLLASVANATSPELRVLLDQTLESMQTHRAARGVGAVVGTVTLLFGASGVFSELQAALNVIWRVKAPLVSGLWRTIANAIQEKAFAFVIVIGAAACLLALLIASTALNAIGESAARVTTAGWVVIEMLLSLALLTGLLAVMFRVLPQAEVKWRDVLGGALLTAILLTALKHLLAWYLAHLGSYAAYGAVGAVLGLLTWIYLASLFFFLGAEFTRVYAERFGSVAKAKSASAGDVGVRDASPEVHDVGPHPGA